MTLTCSQCGGEHARAGQRLCHRCHARYQRSWRKSQAEKNSFYRSFYEAATKTSVASLINDARIVTRETSESL